MVGDSIVAKPRLEPLTTLAYLAGITTRVRLGTAVLLPGAAVIRSCSPTRIANVDQISQGRVVMGLGVGLEACPSAEREWADVAAPTTKRPRPDAGRARRDLAGCSGAASR